MATKLERNGKLDLITELSLTQRRVDQLIEVGVLVAGHDEKFDVEWNVRRYRAYRADDREYVISELTEAAEKFEDGMRRLKAEPDMTKRRKLADRDNIGAQIGRLDAAYRLGNAMSEEGRRPLLSRYTGQEVGKAISAYFGTLGMVINDDTSLSDANPPNRHDRRRARRA
jgi:hypothetical protein